MRLLSPPTLPVRTQRQATKRPIVQRLLNQVNGILRHEPRSLQILGGKLDVEASRLRSSRPLILRVQIEDPQLCRCLIQVRSVDKQLTKIVKILGEILLRLRRIKRPGGLQFDRSPVRQNIVGGKVNAIPLQTHPNIHPTQVHTRKRNLVMSCQHKGVENPPYQKHPDLLLIQRQRMFNSPVGQPRFQNIACMESRRPLSVFYVQPLARFIRQQFLINAIPNHSRCVTDVNHDADADADDEYAGSLRKSAS